MLEVILARNWHFRKLIAKLVCVLILSLPLINLTTIKVSYSHHKKYNKLSGLEQQGFIQLEFCKPEV